MKSLDANILLRWLTRDDPQQALRADAVMRLPVFVSLTVLIEVVWTLRRGYRFDRAMLHAALRTLIDLKTVTIAEGDGVRWALERHLAGADLPDMLHLLASKGAASFVTFERTLAAKAGTDTPIPIETIA